MLSIETEARITKLFLEISRGENTIEINRRIMANNYDFDSYQIFNYLDIENKNRIDSLDLINYLNYKKINITDIEAQLIILFYDQNFDGVLAYDEFKSLILNSNELSSKPTANNFLGKISPDIDKCLFNILENEVRLARNCLSLLEELKTRKDFNIHSIYHILRGFNCITEKSLNEFLIKKNVIFTENDIISLRKRLDLNKDGKIDLSELHAFLGYPECSICCPSTPCSICKMKDCNICFSDSSCLFHNKIHDDIFSRYLPEFQKMNFYKTDMSKINEIMIINKNNNNNDNINDNKDNNKNDIINDNKDITNNKNLVNVNENENNLYDNNNDKDNNNIDNIDNIEYSNKTFPQINNNNDYNFNYTNNSSPKTFDLKNKINIPSSQKVSKNLILRTSPERKYNPNRILSPPSEFLEVNNKNKKSNISKLSNNNDYLNEKINNNENQFLNYLKEAMITEKKIEEYKIKLSLNEDFNCEDAFRIFEKNSREYLTNEDLEHGLNLLNINPSKIELDLIMNKYSLKKEGILEFGDFFDIVVPYEKQYRNIVENRIPNSTYVLRSPNIFSYNTRICLKDLLNLIISEEYKLNNLRKEFSHSLINEKLEEFFNEIDISKNKHFDEQDLLIYIQKKEIFIDENACDLLFIRLDSNRDGIVEFKEIKKEFKAIF